MKKILTSLFVTLLTLSLGSPSVFADSATHTWTGSAAATNGDNTLDIDDHGGSFNNDGNNDTYALGIDGVDQTASISLILFDGTTVDDGVDPNDDADDSTGDIEDFINGSGLQILTPASVFNPPIDQIAAQSDSPLTPISYQGRQTGLDVQHLSYIQDGTDFAIFEFIITNNTGDTVPVFAGIAADYDLDEGSSDDTNDKDLSVPVVLEYDATDDTNSGFFYAAGVALAGNNPLHLYRLGSCCDISFENATSGTGRSVEDIQRLAYFNARPEEECDNGFLQCFDGTPCSSDGDCVGKGGKELCRTRSGNGCSANCLNLTGSEVCGNGIIETGENCDDGNTDNNDGCDFSCRSEDCGNGTLDPGEECDDGNTEEFDGCSSFCTANFNDSEHYCGDSIVNNGGTGDQITTEKDSEVTLSTDLGLLAPGKSATAAFCIVGGISKTSGMDAGQKVIQNAQDCQALYQQNISICGNGFLNAGEGCDDGNETDDDGCDSNCTETTCGNAIVTSGEECDDGNLNDGDGCDSNCLVEDTNNTNNNSNGCQLNPLAANPGGFWQLWAGMILGFGLWRFRRGH